jgi:hypothetical protein
MQFTSTTKDTNMKTKIMLTVLALVASAFIAGAQDKNDGPLGGGGPGGPGRHHRPPPLPIATALDANHDGIIDSNEIANASAGLLMLDKNGDGILTTNEYLPPLPTDAPADAPRPPTPLILKALDANGDGVIDATEIASVLATLMALDKNGDGKLTREEYLGPCPPRPDHQNGPDGQIGQGPDGSNNNLPPGPPPGEDGGNNPQPGPPPGEN